MNRRLNVSLASVLMLASCVSFIVPPSKAAVTGGIIPCAALSVPGGPHYGAGTVTVLRGHVTWKTIGPGSSQIVLPTPVVAREWVATNEAFRFVLDPGSYVLDGEDPRTNALQYADVTLQPGDDKIIDIPNPCF